jgi:hypothetical protein
MREVNRKDAKVAKEVGREKLNAASTLQYFSAASKGIHFSKNLGALGALAVDIPFPDGRLELCRLTEAVGISFISARVLRPPTERSEVFCGCQDSGSRVSKS